MYGQNEPIQNGQQQMEGAEEVAQELPMFEYFGDQTNGFQLRMIPYYYSYFQGMVELIHELRTTVNEKWKPQQIEKYLLFLNDLHAYIASYIFNGTVMDYNVFEKAMNDYGEGQNPIGFQLYQRQVDYICKKASGYDFKLEKKKNKKKNEPKQEPKRRQRQQKPRQEQIVRKEDPKITTAELLTKRDWQIDRYTDLKNFHKENANLVFIGHVDSGKSTLTGNIIKQLKEVDEQQLSRNKQEAKENHMQAWQLSYIADVDPNERKRGKTVECSKMMFTLQHRRFTLFDAPGHKNYVPNMIMGACQADIAILVISAKDGEFQSGFEKQGQTKEHAMLATALGVKSLIAVVSKMGTVQWSQQRYKHIKQQVTPFLKTSCGFNNVKFIPIDSLENRNVHERVTGTWYQGSCLIEEMNVTQIPKRDPDGPLRIPVVDKFRDVGQFFLYGKLESGKIAYEGQDVTVLPRRRPVIIKEIINAKDERLPYALAGENVKLRVKGIEENQIMRGDILCSNMNYAQESQEFKAQLTVLELPDQKKIMSSGYECILHMHAISEQAQIAEVEGKIDKQTKKTMKATFLKTGQTGKIVIKLKNSVCMEKFDFMPSLGRFTLRDEGKTVGYGTVLKIKPSKNLTKEQKEHLGQKSEVEALANGMSKVEIKKE